MSSSHSVDWTALHHAYGAAADVPKLLERIVDFPAEPDWQAEPWFSLWSVLYHQGDIYPASIAAVPRVVSTLSTAPDKATLSFYLLPASIAIADSFSPVAAPLEIRDNFSKSLVSLGTIASAALPSITDPNMPRLLKRRFWFQSATPNKQASCLRQTPNNAFKPKLHRYAVHMAGKACHMAVAALQFGLT
jgi:hypothetical protein